MYSTSRELYLDRNITSLMYRGTTIVNCPTATPAMALPAVIFISIYCPPITLSQSRHTNEQHWDSNCTALDRRPNDKNNNGNIDRQFSTNAIRQRTVD